MRGTFLDFAAFEPACRRIADGAWSSHSIDEFIDREEDETVAFCGKVAIGKAILEAEAHSKLNTHGKSRLDNDKVEETWLPTFFRQLQRGVPRSMRANLFHNVGFVNFNYDRCLEWFLLLAIEDAYGVPRSESQALVRGLGILHPYGTVGQIFDDGSSGLPVPFGHHSANLLWVARDLRTYTEQVAEDTLLHQIKKLVADAEVIVFLGFGFHPQNVKILMPPLGSRAARVFATAYLEPQPTIYTLINPALGALAPRATRDPPSDSKCLPFTQEHLVMIAAP